MRSPSRLLFSVALSASTAVAVACGGPSVERGGQSSLAERTFAGQNKCNPKNHNRPFIVDWDATDQSSFQARAASDVVFVRYEGCDLQVLDACSVDSVKGAFGGYGRHRLDDGAARDGRHRRRGPALREASPRRRLARRSRAEGREVPHGVLRQRHPLGHARAPLPGRARQGPGCKGATHFVYGYNLGAFALASHSNLQGEVNGSYLGFGTGGSHSSQTKTDKKGGDLGSCTSDSAKEVDTCKVPIRLTLREITEGDDPQTAPRRARRRRTAPRASPASSGPTPTRSGRRRSTRRPPSTSSTPTTARGASRSSTSTTGWTRAPRASRRARRRASSPAAAPCA